MHYRGSRGKGSGIFGKIRRDNDGKVLLPAGLIATSKDFLYRIKLKIRRGFRIGA